MGATRKPTRTPAAGDAIDSSLSASPDHGTSSAPAVRQTTSQADADALLEALINNENRPHRGPRCGLGRVLAQIEEGRRAKLVYLLDQSDRSNPEIATAFQALGYTFVSYHMVGHHRKRLKGVGCKCPK